MDVTNSGPLRPVQPKGQAADQSRLVRSGAGEAAEPAAEGAGQPDAVAPVAGKRGRRASAQPVGAHGGLVTVGTDSTGSTFTTGTLIGPISASFRAGPTDDEYLRYLDQLRQMVKLSMDSGWGEVSIRVKPMIMHALDELAMRFTCHVTAKRD